MIEKTSDRLASDREATIHWSKTSPLNVEHRSDAGIVRVRHGRFVGGSSDQVEVVEIDTGVVRLLVLPTRGMSIWSMESGGTRFGWNSPVSGPVHPSQVPVFDPSGLGWLEGFDELVVRCGLESNGAPQHDDRGQLVYPLHGRIGNLPADSLSIEYDSQTGQLDLIGEVLESRLFFKRLRLVSRIRVHAGHARVELQDKIRNELDKSATAQLLYHINIGSPVLQSDAMLEVPIVELAPKDDLAAGEIDAWNQFGGPELGYSERVYFAKLRPDASGQSTAMLCSADRSSGLAVTFGIHSLPYFVLWKNTASKKDGYVVGLEPATNLPNNKSFETEQGRVVELEPNETKAFNVTLEPLTDSVAVQRVADQIAKLSTDQPTIHRKPKPGWS